MRDLRETNSLLMSIEKIESRPKEKKNAKTFVKKLKRLFSDLSSLEIA